MAIKSLKSNEHIEIISATDVSQHSLSTFYYVAYPERHNFLAEHWRWLYSGPKLDNTKSWPIIARKVTGEIVGHASTIPAQLIIDNELFDANWFVDYFVSNEYRGTGLARLLIEEIMATSIVAGAIGASSKGQSVFRHHGWSEYWGTISYVLPINISRHRRLHSIPFNSFFRIADSILRHFYRLKLSDKETNFDLLPISLCNLKDFTNNVSDSAESFTPFHDESFLKWRLLDFPFQDEIKVYSSTHSSAVIRFARSTNYSRINILKVKTTVPSKFFNDMLAIALNNYVDEISLITSDKRLQCSFNKYFPIRKTLPLYLFSKSKLLPPAKSAWAIRCEMIDSDLDLVHTSW